MERVEFLGGAVEDPSMGVPFHVLDNVVKVGNFTIFFSGSGKPRNVGICSPDLQDN